MAFPHLSSVNSAAGRAPSCSPGPCHAPSASGGRTRRLLPMMVLALLALVTAGCEGADERFVLSLEGRGSVEGSAFLDLNRDGSPGVGEAGVAGLRVGLVPTGSRDPVAVVTSDAEGVFNAPDLAPGSYRVMVEGGGVLGDSLEVTQIEPDRLQLAVDGAAQVTVGVSFPVRSVAQARAASVGTRLYVEGIALNLRGALPGEVLHLWDGERAIRASGIQPFPHAAGDSVRVLGRVASEDGRTVLSQAQGFRLVERDTIPEPLLLQAREAAEARGGELDAALVRVEGMSVTEVRIVDGTVVATGSDGSGSLQVRMPQAHLTQAGIGALEVGAVLSVTGLLEPRTGAPARWELRTRSGADLDVEAQGVIQGFVFFDRNGSGAVSPGDTPLEGATVRIFRSGDAATPVVEVETDADGIFRSGALDVGSYLVEVRPESLPDSLVVRNISPSPVQVPTGGTADVTVAVSHPLVTTTEARELPDGRTIFLSGTALNARTALGDESVHLRDGVGALRTLGVQQTVLAGDRVRLRGRTATVAGQRVLVGVTPFVESEGGVPAPLIVTTAQAAGAGAGALDGDAVRLREVVISAAAPVDEVPGRWRVTVSDGSGPVELEVRLASVGILPADAAEFFRTGRRLNVNGLLIPFVTPPDDPDDDSDGDEAETEGWRVHPRVPADVTPITAG